MTHSQASSVASFLNAIYTGPLDGTYAGCAAFSDLRTCQVDFDCNWVYYVVSPHGAFLNGKQLTFKEVSDVIADAMDILGVPGGGRRRVLRYA